MTAVCGRLLWCTPPSASGSRLRSIQQSRDKHTKARNSNERKHNKIIISAIAAGLSAYFRVMAIPIVILVLVMIIDYITGMWKAWNRGELSSRVGLKGLFKKVGYIFVVAVSGVLDWLFISGLSQIGIEVNVSFYFGLIVTIWFIINECISILENLAVIGIPLPSFLVKIVHKLKITVENKVDTNEDTNESEE